MEGLVALLMPVAIVGIVSYFRFRTKQLAAGHSPGSSKELDELRADRKQLEARVQNLESIICSVDFDAIERFAKLETAAKRQLAAPAPSEPITESLRAAKPATTNPTRKPDQGDD